MLTDTGVLVALLDKGDAKLLRSKGALRRVRRGKSPR